MSENFAFDKRIAHMYNEQRVHPPDVSRKVGEAIIAHVAGDKRILEIGVGTGRIAAPVAAAGGKVAGFDLSAEMLGEVEERSTYDLLQADMSLMPFASDAFDAVMAIHVLHLTKELEKVMGEAIRVLRPDGVFIQGDDWTDPKSVVGQLRDSIRQQVIQLAPQFKPPAASKSRSIILDELGAAETTEVIAAEWTIYVSPSERLEVIAARMDPESWMLPKDLFDQIMIGLRQHVAATWPNPEEAQPVTRRFILKVTRGHWQ